MSKSDTPIIFKRENYEPPAYAVDQIDLDIDLHPSKTIVKSSINLRAITDKPLVLKGEGLELISLKVDGNVFTDYELSSEQLVLRSLPKSCLLEMTCSNAPDQNTSLMGLYVSRGNFFTQCEAEGFRKITYFLDQPDVLTKYRVTLRANREQCPVLLANGNLVDQQDLGKGRHSATWEDPFPKPSYLFALVAGKLSCIEEKIKSKSGKDQLLQVWVEESDLPKAKHAMDSLINAIRWDEERFGLELDLERFMIVAVSDFNMGAMENKGLNIFNTKYVLADANSATDIDFANIESVVGHEYFHNWTGNRVTCRDWFQLSLKEGLTVFRDQEFSADLMGSESGRAVKRIEDVRLLRQLQFPEDAGPMAHPIRPDSYQEINNFYTVTIYEKGAEVVRMQQTLLGKDGFRKGMDLYFKRHDGQAVTCDDFVAAMSDANQIDLTQFKLWYSQAGTPQVQVKEKFNVVEKTYELTLSQSCPSSPGQEIKAAFHIPLKTKLLGINNSNNNSSETLIELKKSEEKYVFNDCNTKPILSINREFSAPIILDFDQSLDDQLYLFEHDDDSFNRWEAGQKLAQHWILSGQEIDQRLVDIWGRILNDDQLNPAFKELAISLPSEAYLHEQVEVVDPQAIHQSRRSFRKIMASKLENQWVNTYEKHQTLGNYSPDSQSAGLRTLKNHALHMLIETGKSEWQDLAYRQFNDSNNMTDRIAALSALVNQGSPYTPECLDIYFQRYEKDDLALDKWFALQATRQFVEGASVLNSVKELKKHPAFKLNNPNRARSVIHAFCLSNPGGFHQLDGRAYAFWADCVIELNTLNPQVAARLARGMDRWKKFKQPYQDLMKAQIERVAKEDKLSPDVQEVITKSLD
jgi:aminopeptidase N